MGGSPGDCSPGGERPSSPRSVCDTRRIPFGDSLPKLLSQFSLGTPRGLGVALPPLGGGGAKCFGDFGVFWVLIELESLVTIALGWGGGPPPMPK
jgi:hypothetical protein